MANITKDTRPLAIRLWVFQRERAPLLAMIIMASLTVGVFANFTNTKWNHFVAAVGICMLYLLQTRTSDEKKDFEHDNKYHKDRPVQRGVVTLKELYAINQLAIISQVVIYASFLNMRILLFGLLSQGYAFLTRKEFFVRDWIRKHFWTYYFFHYIQLVTLNLAIVSIVRPTTTPVWQLIIFVMLNIVIVELARKMFAVEDDTTDDTFSYQLGHKGSAWALSLMATAITLDAFYFMSNHAQNYLFLIAPIAATGFTFNSAYHYAIKPDRPNANNVKNAGIFMFLTGLASVILGA